MTTLQEYNGPVKSLKRTIQERIRSKIANRVAQETDSILDAQVGIATDTEQGSSAVQAAKLLFEQAGLTPAKQVKHSGAIGIVALVAQLESNGDNNNTTDEE